MHRGDRPGQLVAIVRTDIVGSTDVLTDRGVGIAMDMQRSARGAVERVSGAGTVLEFRGDGSVVGFASAHEALRAAWRLRELVGEQDYRLRIAVTLEQAPDRETLSAGMQARTQSFEGRCRPGAIIADDRIQRAVRGHDHAVFSAVDHETGELTAFNPESGSAKGRCAVRTVLFSEPVMGDSEADGSAAQINERCIGQHGGNVVNVQGGRYMATFASCIDALRAANDIHRSAVSHGSRADATGAVSFRVAASVGEIVEADDDSFGVAVIEAARLAAMAEANSTLVSADVFDLSGCSSADGERRCAVPLKGLTDPVDVIHIVHSSTPLPLLDVPASLRLDPDRPLVGRTEELVFLQERLEETMQGRPRVVVIDGEEGIGKSRLAAELANRAHDIGLTVLHGACDKDPGAPFAPVVDALGRAAPLDPTIDQAVSAGDGPLRAIFATGPTGVGDHRSNQSELFGLVSEALQRLCDTRAVVFVLDDVQWASDDTTRMVARMLGQTSARLLMVLTHRSEPATHGTTLGALLDDATGGVDRHQIKLERLTRDDMAAIVEARTSPDVTSLLVDVVSQTTGGSPLYVDEFLNHLITTRVVARDPAAGWAVARNPADMTPPASIIDLMSRRIAGLGGESCDLLGVAALLGGSFDIEVLAAATDRPIEPVLDIVEAATQARLLRVADVAGIYSFGDEITRAAFLRNVSPSRRPLWHERLAGTIEKLRPHQLDLLISHWSGAIGQHSRNKVVHYLGQAIERDMAAGAWQSAITQAESVLDMLDEDQVEIECETKLVLGAALRLLGAESYRPHLTAAADLARRLRDPERLLRSATAMMRPGEWTPEAGVVDSEIVEMCEDVLLLVDEPDDPVRIQALAALASNLAFDGDLDRRVRLTGEAQERARRLGDLRLLGKTLVAELLSCLGPTDFERRRVVADEVRRIGRAIGDSDLAFAGGFFAMLDALERGDVDDAESILRRLRRSAETSLDFFSRYRVAYLEAVIALAKDEPRAQELMDAAHQMAEGEPIDAFGPLVLQAATLAMYRGTLSDMLIPIAQATDMWEDSWTQRWDFALAKAYLDTGELDKAAEIIGNNSEPDFDSYWLASSCQLAEVGWLLDYPDICARVIDDLTPFRGRFVLVGSGLAVTGLASVALGQAHLGIGELDMAEELLREGVEQAEKAGFPYFATNAKRLLAQALSASDPSSFEAAALLDEVLAQSAACDFNHEREVAAGLLEP